VHTVVTRLLKPLPEPCLLVRASGELVAINDAGVRLLGAAATPGASLLTLFADADAVRRCLAQFSRSSSPLPSALRLADRATAQTLRCDGALVEPGPDPLLLLRLKPGETAGVRFLALNERIAALNREIRERRRAEVQLQEQAVELEHIAAELEQTVEELQQQTEEATAARDSAQQSAQRLATLAEAGAVLAGSIDQADTLRRLAEIAVRTTADFCITYLVGLDGALGRIGGAHADPEQQPWVDRLVREYPGLEDASPVADVMRSGEPVLVTRITDDMLCAAATDTAQLEILRALAPASTILAPLMAPAGAVGAITLARGAGRPGFSEDDLAAAHELARRAALTVDNARLFEAAQRANVAKSAFLATMSHELRTPLNAVVGYTDLLDAETAGPLLPAQREQLGRIQAAAEHLRAIIEEILLFARIEAGKERVRLSDVELPALIEGVAELMRPAADRQGLQLELRPADGISIVTDPDRLRQILLNLVANAVKFTDSGTVTIDLECFDDTVAIAVSDTGIGIATEHLERIFEPFWQVEGGTTREAGGTGLGLTVTLRLARLLGGDIAVESTPGVGSTFTVRLPRETAGTRRIVGAGSSGRVRTAGGRDEPPVRRVTSGPA
jgi:signal transduction histidine kinase